MSNNLDAGRGSVSNARPHRHFRSMHAPLPHNPNLLHVANQAQHMARNTRQEYMALAFQSVAMVSMAIMGLAAAAQMLREVSRREKPSKGRG